MNGKNILKRYIHLGQINNDISDKPTPDTVQNPEPPFDEKISILEVKSCD